MLKILTRRAATVSASTRNSIQAKPIVSCAVTPPIRCPGLVRPTPVALIPIPPIVWKVVSVGGVFLIDAFLRAHAQHVAKMAKEEEAHASAQPGTGSPISKKEAADVLGLPDAAGTTALNERQRDEAKRRFEVLFLKAERANSPYLQGKISAAYRVLCDPNWDEELLRKHQQQAETATDGGSPKSTDEGGGAPKA